ncbi:MAG: hypothetical protein WAT20_07220 [Ferruginibacter sp.]|nr:hypothetical protein [Chitinophagaceae bacterium]
MPHLKIKQLQYEINSWKRFLDYLTEENIQMKNRLSEILKEKFDTYLLEEVDGFQTRFIRKDHLVEVLRGEVMELDAIPVAEIFKDEKIFKKIKTKIKRLHKNIINTEKQFSKLKADFHRFLSTNIL